MAAAKGLRLGNMFQLHSPDQRVVLGRLHLRASTKRRSRKRNFVAFQGPDGRPLFGKATNSAGIMSDSILCEIKSPDMQGADIRSHPTSQGNQHEL